MDEETLAAFRLNTCDEGDSSEIARHCPRTFAKLSDLMTSYYAMEDAGLIG